MKILGIDPGINKLGFGIVEDINFRIIDVGVINLPLKIEFEKKIENIIQKFESIINKNRPDMIAIEEVYVAKNVQIALKIGILTGGIIWSSISKKIKFILIPPREIKLLLTGKGSATKEQVKFMVENLTNFKNFKSYEESDAVATAISGIFKIKENAILFKR